MMKTGLAAAALLLPLAGCATPEEVKRPLARPTLAQPVPLPDLAPYQAPVPLSSIPHGAPRSDRPATP